MIDFPAITAVIIAVNASLCFWRVFKGPTIEDRINGSSLITTKLLAILVLLALMFETTYYLDVALAFAIINYVVTFVLCRYLEQHDWEEPANDDSSN